MSEVPIEVVQTLLSVIAGLLAVLIAVVGWIGNRIFQRMDSINSSLRESEANIYARLNDHGERLVRVETQLEINGVGQA